VSRLKISAAQRTCLCSRPRRLSSYSALIAISTLVVVLLGSACGSSAKPKAASSTNIALIDAKSGAVDYDLPKFDYRGGPLPATDDGSGGWYVGGSFTRVGGEKSTGAGVVRLRSDGSLDSAFRPDLPRHPRISAMMRHGRVLYVGGRFGVIAIDTSSGERLWTAPIKGGTVVNDFAYGGGVLYVVGDFKRIGGKARRSEMAALNANTGEVNSWHVNVSYPNFVSFVSAVAYSDGQVFLGGLFKKVDGVRRPAGLAAFNARSGRLTDWAPNPKYPYGSFINGGADLLVAYGQVLLGFGDEAHFTAIDARTARPLVWVKKLQSCVSEFARSGDTVFLSGGGDVPDNIYRVNGKPARNLASVILPEGRFTNWRPNLGRCVLVYSIAPSGGKVLVTGHFSSKGCG
jgi:outer membrane protein assembly factor BamB